MFPNEENSLHLRWNLLITQCPWTKWWVNKFTMHRQSLLCFFGEDQLCDKNGNGFFHEAGMHYHICIWTGTHARLLILMPRFNPRYVHRQTHKSCIFFRKINCQTFLVQWPIAPTGAESFRNTEERHVVSVLDEFRWQAILSIIVQSGKSQTWERWEKEGPERGTGFPKVTEWTCLGENPVPLTAALRMGTIYFLQLLLPFWPPTLGGSWEAGGGCCSTETQYWCHPLSKKSSWVRLQTVPDSTNTTPCDLDLGIFACPYLGLFLIAPNRKRLKCLPAVEWTLKLWNIYTVWCFTAVRINYLQLHTTIWWIP